MDNVEEKVEKEFRIQNKWVYLTYTQCDFDKKEYKQWLRDKQKGKISDIQVAREHHKDGNAHMHVLITYKKAFQTRNVTFYDYADCHPHVGDKHSKNPKNAKEYAACLMYICKEDEEMVPNPVIQQCHSVWQCESLSETMLHADPLRAKVLWDSRPTDFQWKPIKLPDQYWYKEVDAILDKFNPLNINWYRKLIWVKDAIGDTGKTVWGLHKYQNKVAWYVNHIGQVRDLAMNIKIAREAGWNGKMLILDLPRDAKDFVSIYSALEMIKSGLVTQTKYLCENIHIPFKLKIVVLANFWPKFNKNSIDRWLAIELVHCDKIGKTVPEVKDVIKLMNEESDDHKYEPMD